MMMMMMISLFRLSAVTALGLEADCMPLVWVSELGQSNIEDHTPDHVITVHSEPRYTHC